MRHIITNVFAMRHVIIAVVFALFSILACACGKDSILQPKTGPGTDYPCGLQGVVCPGHMCCWRQEVCGGPAFSGCPANYCCYVGPDDGNLAAHKSHPQFAEHL